MIDQRINQHSFKSETLDASATNCDFCGEQYGARYVRPCPAAAPQEPLCPACGAFVDANQATMDRLKADAQALADVRTLDDWRNNPPSLIVYGKPMKRSRVIRYGECGGRVMLATIAVMMPGVPGDSPDEEAREVVVWFDGETDEEARAKAAAWVRSERERGQR